MKDNEYEMVDYANEREKQKKIEEVCSHEWKENLMEETERRKIFRTFCEKCGKTKIGSTRKETKRELTESEIWR